MNDETSQWTLNCSFAEDLDPFDPTRACSPGARQLARLISRQLLTHRGGANWRGWQAVEPVPDLAVAVPSIYTGSLGASHRSHVVQLRAEARWGGSQPRQVTSSDVMRGFQRVCAPGHPPAAKSMLMNTIRGLREFDAGVRKELSAKATPTEFAEFCRVTPVSGVVLLDELSVVVESVRPTLEMASLLALPCVAPAPEEHEAFFPAQGDLMSWCSNGPFRPASDRRDEAGLRVVTLERNPAWCVDSDPVRTSTADGVVATFGVDASFGRAQSGPTVVEYRDEPGLEWHGDAPTNTPLTWVLEPYVVFNHTRAAVSGVRDRAAVVQAFDASQVVAQLQQLIPAAGYRDAEAFYSKAQFGIHPPTTCSGAESTRTPGELVALTPPGRLARVAEVCWRQLEAAGWSVQRVTPSTLEAYRAAVNHAEEAEWDITVASWVPSWLQDHQRDLCEVSFAPDSPGNWGRYRSEEAERLLGEAIATVVPQQSRRRWSAVMDVLLGEYALVPVATRPLGASWDLDEAVEAPRLPELDLRPDLAQCQRR